jgi:hypothetical protein
MVALRCASANDQQNEHQEKYYPSEHHYAGRPRLAPMDLYHFSGIGVVSATQQRYPCGSCE